MVLVDGVVYREEFEDVEDGETTTEGGGSGGGWGGGAGGVEGGGIIAACAAGSEATDTKPWWWWWWSETKAAWAPLEVVLVLVLILVEETIWLVASLYLCLKISVLIALSSACRVWICCCKADISPMHPYTGSLILRFASYTRLFAASALWLSGNSYVCISMHTQIMLSIITVTHREKME